MQTTDRLLQIEEMLKKEPEDSFLNYALAMEYKATGNIKVAIEILEKLLKINPGYLGTYYQLGQLLELESRQEQAKVVYKEGIKLATAQRNTKTLGELNEALWMLEDE